MATHSHHACIDGRASGQRGGGGETVPRGKCEHRRQGDQVTGPHGLCHRNKPPKRRAAREPGARVKRCGRRAGAAVTRRARRIPADPASRSADAAASYQVGRRPRPRPADPVTVARSMVFDRIGRLRTGTCPLSGFAPAGEAGYGRGEERDRNEMTEVKERTPAESIADGFSRTAICSSRSESAWVEELQRAARTAGFWSALDSGQAIRRAGRPGQRRRCVRARGQAIRRHEERPGRRA